MKLVNHGRAMINGTVDSLIQAEFKELQKKFQALYIVKNKSSGYVIFGTLAFSTQYEGLNINDSFIVEILVPSDYPQSLPKVKEISKRIPQSFHHYLDETLCLGTPVGTRIDFEKKPSLLGFVETCVIPYFCSFIHWEETGETPKDELPHGGLGVFEYYKKTFFKHCSLDSLRNILLFINNSSYKGHTLCPCGSRSIMRKCHGQQILKIKKIASQEEVDFEIKQIDLYIQQLKDKKVNKNKMASLIESAIHH